MGLLAGIAALVFGLHALVTRRAAIGDDSDEPYMWLYGWRAVAIGCAAVLVAAVFFAAAAGFIQLDWG
jgi:hypothetical protein